MKPTCNLECATCRYQIDPTHCADVVSGEQGPGTDELEIARLRRERIEQEATNLEMGGEIARLRRELEEAKSERDDARTKLAAVHEDLLVVEGNHCVDREDHAAELAKLRGERDEARAKVEELTRYAESTIGSLVEGLERVDHAAQHHARAVEALRVALRDLINACENTRPSHIPTPVVAAIEAARAVLGEDGS